MADAWYRRNRSKLQDPDAKCCEMNFKIMNFEQAHWEDRKVNVERNLKEESYKKNHY